MRRRSALLVPAVVVAAAVVPLAATGTAAATAQPDDLFFSEYVEGSSNNKALEIYNGTGAAVDLAAGGYRVVQYSNGSSTGTTVASLQGSVAPGDVFVLAHSSAVADVRAVADQTTGAGLFNGDDAVALVKGTQPLDVIGQIGVDPGTEWGTGATSTSDNTLRRLATVCAGDPDGSDAFDPSVQWSGHHVDTFDGLGEHTADCGEVPAAGPVINEFSASTTGTDVEYLEILAEPGADLSGYTVLEVEGDASSSALGAVASVTALGTADASGFYLADLPANTLQNGTMTLLLVEGFTGARGDDLDTDNDGTLDATPWITVTDAVAVNDGGTGDLTYGKPALGASFDGGAFAPGGASRIPDGTDTDAAADWVRNDFDLAGIAGFTGTPDVGEAYNTPGAPNAVVQAPDPGADTCESPTTAVYSIQGDGAASELVGDSVLTEGVVVGRFQSGSTDTVYIQDAKGDGDPATSDGIHVFADASGIPTGSTVRVRGTVTEYFGMTQLADATIFACGTGMTEIDPVELTLPFDGPDAPEAYEGMLVTFPQDLVISEYFNYDRFGELVLTDERQVTPTAIVEPGDPARALAAEQALARITLDDSRSAENPDPARHPNGETFTLDNTFRGGDLVTGVTGVLDYRFNLYRVQPTQGAEYTAVNARPGVPEVGSDFTVGSFNVLNYFTTLAGQGGRGADTAAELERQEAKIISALSEMDADVVGLIEIENNTAAIERLVGALNAKVGAGTYDYVDTGVIGTDAIKVAFIYNTTTAATVGDYAILDSGVDPRFDDTKNRPALAQTFTDTATGGVVTVAVNHLKSKGSACAGDPDTGDGSGNCNLTRTAAAEALVDWLGSDPTGSGSDNHLLIGDLNSYDKEDPIDALVAGGFTDLVARYEGEEAYSYVFDGKVGYLDHALASEGLLEQVTGAAVWNINADEPDLIDYDMSFKKPAQDALYAPDPYRSSDHDPVLVGLELTRPDTVAPTLEVKLSHESLWPANHRYVDVTATITASDDSGVEPTVELVSVVSDEPDDGEDDGSTVDDVVVVDDTTFRLRAERSGSGDGRTYTVTYRATDGAGNETTTTATVEVPLSRR